MTNKCKKCLLLEAGEEKSFKTVNDYINNNGKEISFLTPSPLDTRDYVDYNLSSYVILMEYKS